MAKFRRLVSIDKVALVPAAVEELKNYADEIILAQDIPADNAEIIRRIKEADAVLLSANSRLEKEAMEQAPNLKYVGMCCSLYSEESANVDIPFARTRGITVKGIRDYGDRGVAEYVIYQLVQLLHGYQAPLWEDAPREITGLKVGFVGLGTSGAMTAEALQALGAEISYFARSVKPEREAAGMHFKLLKELLEESDVVITALNKNVILLHAEEFAALGTGKIMINTSIGPAADLDELEAWLQNPKNILCSDTKAGLGERAEKWMEYPNVYCTDKSAGMTKQAYELLSRKVLDNIREYQEI